MTRLLIARDQHGNVTIQRERLERAAWNAISLHALPDTPALTCAAPGAIDTSLLERDFMQGWFRSYSYAA